MKRKNVNYILTALCFIFFILAFWINDPFDIFVSNYENSDPLMEDLQINKVVRIVVQQGTKETLSFYKKSEADNSWVVKKPNEKTEYKVDFSLLNKGLENILSIKKYQEVTSNKEKHTLYEVDSSGMSILLFEKPATREKPNYHLYLGKSGSNFNSTLVRLKEKDSVYSAKGNLKTDWEKDIDHFRNKSLFELVPENITSYEVKGAYNYSLKRSKSSEWELIENRSPIPVLARQDKVKDILKQVCELKADSFHKGTPPRRVHARIILSLSNKTKLNLNIFGPNKDDVFIVQSNQTSFWAEISKWKIENILIKSDEIRKEKARSEKPPIQ